MHVPAQRHGRVLFHDPDWPRITFSTRTKTGQKQSGRASHGRPVSIYGFQAYTDDYTNLSHYPSLLYVAICMHSTLHTRRASTSHCPASHSTFYLHSTYGTLHLAPHSRSAPLCSNPMPLPSPSYWVSLYVYLRQTRRQALFPVIHYMLWVRSWYLSGAHASTTGF